MFDPSPEMRSFEDSDVPYLFAWEQSGQHALFQARYDEALASVDAEVGRFVADLEQRGVLNNTILIISADHGESFTADYGGHSGPKLHDALTRIPLIFKGPGFPPGLRIDQPVSQVDLAPTILDLAGDARSGAGMEGRSLRSLLVGGKLPPNDIFSMAFERSNRFGTLAAGSLALTRGQWKFVHYWGQPDRPGYRDLADALYDTRSDPSESRDVTSQNPEIARAMQATILQMRATMASAAIKR
jgi:arylsulfatase A-like enzyme